MQPDRKAILDTLLKEYVARNRDVMAEQCRSFTEKASYVLWIDTKQKQIWLQPHKAAEKLVLNTQVGCACFLEELLQNGYAITVESP